MRMHSTPPTPATPRCSRLRADQPLDDRRAASRSPGPWPRSPPMPSPGKTLKASRPKPGTRGSRSSRSKAAAIDNLDERRSAPPSHSAASGSRRADTRKRRPRPKPRRPQENPSAPESSAGLARKHHPHEKPPPQASSPPAQQSAPSRKQRPLLNTRPRREAEPSAPVVSGVGPERSPADEWRSCRLGSARHGYRVARQRCRSAALHSAPAAASSASSRRSTSHAAAFAATPSSARLNASRRPRDGRRPAPVARRSRSRCAAPSSPTELSIRPSGARWSSPVTTATGACSRRPRRSVRPLREPARPHAVLARVQANWRALELDSVRGVARLPAGHAASTSARPRKHGPPIARRPPPRVRRAAACSSASAATSPPPARRPPAAGGSTSPTTIVQRARRAGQTIVIASGAVWRHRAPRSGAGRHAGRAMHHVIDPATGAPVRDTWRTVSVAAATCTDANIADHHCARRGPPAPPAGWLERLGCPRASSTATAASPSIAGWPTEEPRGTTRRHARERADGRSRRGPSLYWYLTRSTGAVALLLLTLALVLGVLDVRALQQRFAGRAS